MKAKYLSEKVNNYGGQEHVRRGVTDSTPLKCMG
jgi:hypothetical protein